MTNPLSFRPRRDRSRGAALVEFALIAPLLLLLLFGILEFGYGMLQYLDVRHGARETGRLVAVNYRPTSSSGTTQAGEIIDEGCTRLDNDDNISFTITQVGGSGVGQEARVTVNRDYRSLTGFFNFVSIDMDSTVEVRMEQAATWANRTKACP